MLDLQPPARWWAWLQLSALASFPPLALLIGPKRVLAETQSVLIIAVAVAVAAIVIFEVLSRLVGEGWKALAWVSIATVFFWYWNPSSTNADFGFLWIISATLLAIALAGVGVVSGHRYFRAGVFVTSIAVAIVIILLGAQSALTTPASEVAPQSIPDRPILASRPDITLIVLDGYGRSDVMNELFSFDNSQFEAELENSGFNIVNRAMANYTITHLSIPSMLNMAYMHRPGATLGANDLDTLASAVSGDNEVVEILKEAGYQYVQGDTDHPNLRCGPATDQCLGRPLLDLTMLALLERTPIGPLLYPASGNTTNALNARRLTELENWTMTKSKWANGPTFTYLHLLLPHPPLAFDESCDINEESGFGGRSLSLGAPSDEELQKRKAGWVTQVQCVNATLETFIEQLEDDEVVIITSDHGPDSIYTLFGDVTQYTPEMLRERLPTFTALRLPDRCDPPPDDLVLVNLFRVVLNCLSEDQLELEMLPAQYFVAGFSGLIVEFPDPQLDTQN